MLDAANMRAQDAVIDLGSGDGRIAIAAGRRGARALGADLDPDRIREANVNAQRAGVGGRVSFRREDLFSRHRSAKPRSSRSICCPNSTCGSRRAPGTRIVSYRFAMGDWTPDATDTNGGTVYLWIVPARVE
jgi:hypothetical protein